MIIAVDTGGTKTLIALFNSRGEVKKTLRFETPKNQDAYLELLQKNLSEFCQDIDFSNVRALTLASPGVVSKNIIVWGGGNLEWRNVDVSSALRKVLPASVPIFAENDGNLGGLGEVRMLKKKYHQALYVTISTGIGGGIVTDGQLNKDLLGIEIGHMILEFDGHLKRWESFASGKAIKQAYGKYARDITSKRAWRHITGRISRGFLALIPVVQPDVIIIGGSIGTHFAKYGPELEQLLRELTHPQIAVPPIIQAKHPEEAVIYGCYYYALAKLANK